MAANNSSYGDRFNQYRSSYQSVQQPNYPPNNQNFGMQQPNFPQQNNYGINNQYGRQQQQFRPQPPPQKLIIPEDWNGMLEFMSTAIDPELRSRVQMKLHEQLFNE